MLIFKGCRDNLSFGGQDARQEQAAIRELFLFVDGSREDLLRPFHQEFGPERESR